MAGSLREESRTRTTQEKQGRGHGALALCSTICSGVCIADYIKLCIILQPSEGEERSELEGASGLNLGDRREPLAISRGTYWPDGSGEGRALEVEVQRDARHCRAQVEV